MLDLYKTDFSKLTGSDVLAAVIELSGVANQPDQRAQEGYLLDFKER